MTRRAFFVVVALASAAPAARAAAQAVPVHPAGDLSALVGMPFDVPIVADWTGRPDLLGSFVVTVTWDTTVLRFMGGARGTFGDIQANVGSGNVKLTGANPTGAGGLITLAAMRFAPRVATSTPLQLSVAELYATGPTFAAVPPAATNGLFCPARGYWGDPDLDGAPGSRDALFALSEAVGLSVPPPPTADIGLADVDADGSIKARDALIILSHAVGLDVSAFRILRVAVGGCGTDVPATYSVTPDTGSVLPGQELAFELRASAAGAVRTIPDVFWRSSDANVVAVLQDGTAIAVGPGTATIVGKSGQRDSATASINVVTSRRTHLVKASAVSAVNRWGTPQFPYAQVAEAAQVAQDGDTVLILPGRYVETNVFQKNVIVLGDSSGGGSQPLIVGQCDFCGGFLFLGTGRSEVANVRFDSVLIAVSAQGPSPAAPSVVRVHDVTVGHARFGVSTTSVVTIVDNVTMFGDTTNTSTTEGVVTQAGGADTVRGSTFTDWDYGVDLEDSVGYVASNTIQRSRFSGVYVYGGSTTASRMRVLGNLVQFPSGMGIGAEYIDSLELRGNLVEDATSPPGFFTPAAISLYGNFTGLARVVGNTVRRSHNQAGILVNQFDTTIVAVDSNAVSGSDSAGVRIGFGLAALTGNNIGNNAGYGLSVQTSSPAIHQVHGGAFVGNVLGGVFAAIDSVDAQGNFWGAATGACTTGADCVVGRVDTTNPLTSDPGGLPPLSPRLRVVALAAPGTTSTRLASSRKALEAERAAITTASAAAMRERLAERARLQALHRAEVERRFAAVVGGSR